MSKWIDAYLIDRQIMIRRVSDEKHFADSAAEKDWWVKLCLKAIFSLPYAPYMLFKGGTSLSKVLATYIYDRTSALTYDEIIQRMEKLREQFRNT